MKYEYNLRDLKGTRNPYIKRGIDMKFLMQKDSGFYVDEAIFNDVYDRVRYFNTKEYITLEELRETKSDLSGMIPFGTIEFVNTYLNKYYGVEQNAIEVPRVLRTDEFLKRDYKIVYGYELSKTGSYFVKNASHLKSFSYIGEASVWNTEEIWESSKNVFDTALHLNKDDLFVYSSLVNVLSEYRVYVLNGKIDSIAHYDGDPLVFPDVELIKKANLIYSTQKDYPKSYTLDIMVTDEGTSIIECHTLFSTGLYTSVFGSKLLYGYRDSLDYVLNHNTKVEKWTK